MKKIFAFILATIMVLSIVPASAFAAFNKCPDTHTKANCDYSFVTEVPSSCTSYGYSVYKCNACGEEFLDDFADELSHPWVSTADSKHVNQAATCTVDGWEWVKCTICTNYTKDADVVACGGACGDDDCLLYKRIIKAEHKPVATGKGIGCETEYKCSVCGTILYYNTVIEDYSPAFEHDWNYAEAETIVEPAWANGVFTKGTAHVVCKREGCPGEKNVDILDMDCKHISYVVVQNYIKETCTTNGQKAVYKCRDCDNYVVDANGDGQFDDDDLLVDKDGKPTKDLSNAVIPALGHKIPEDALGQKVYLAVANCVGTYECVNCKVILTADAHEKLELIYQVDPTCTYPGYKYQYCSACYTNVTETIKETGHTKATITIGASCVNVGAKYTFCTAPNCPLIPQPIRDAEGKTETVNALINAGIGSNYITKDPVYAGYTYSLRVLKTESVKAIDSSKHTLTYTDLNTGIIYAEKPESNCLGYKIIKTTCNNGCAAATTELIPQGDHNEYVSKKYANCNEQTTHLIDILGAGAKEYILNAFFVREEYSCKDCGKVTKYVDTPVTFTMQYESAELADFYHGDIQYIANAGTDYKPVVAVRNTANRAEGSGHNAVEPTCLATGLEIWGCETCKVGFYKVVEKIEHTHKQFETPVYIGGEPATCEKAGTWASLKCVFCKNTVIFNPYLGDNGEQQVVTSLVIAPHGSTLTKVTPSSNATRCKGVSYYQCECGKTFTNWDAKTAYDTKADHHNWKVLQAGVPATCNTNGVYEIKFCQSKDCRRVEVNAFIVEEGEVKEITVASKNRTYKNKAYKDTDIEVPNMNRKADGKFEKKTVTIKKNGTLSGAYSTPVPMLNHNKPFTADSALESVFRGYGENHSTPSYYAMQCSYCDYEYFTDYIAASGSHKNKNGEVLTTDCDNAYIADRICIFCPETDANNDGVADNVIEPIHDYNDVITVKPTCVLGGYTYEQCKKCDYRNILSVTAKTNNYHNTDEFFNSENYIEDGEKSDYAHVGTKYTATCALCNKTVGSYSPVKISQAGLEIYASADAKSYIPGSTVYVTLTLDSLKGVDVWALDFAVGYNNNALEFVGYSFNTNESDFQSFAANDIKSYSNIVEDPYGSNRMMVSDTIATESIGLVKVVANANENVSIKGEQVLAVLEFRVIATKATSAFVRVYDSNGSRIYYRGYESVKTEYGTTVNYATAQRASLKATALDANKNEIPCVYNTSGNVIFVKVDGFLDLDDNGKLNMFDAYELYSLIFNNDYDVQADADYDGRITGLDLAVLYNILTGADTVENYVNPQADITPIQPRNN